MKHIKGLLLVLLHLGAVLGVQILLFRVLLEQDSTLLCVTLSLLIAFLDLLFSILLLKGRKIDGTAQTLLYFWDLFLLIPMLLLGVLGLASDRQGVGFGTEVLLLDLLLIVERSVSFVLSRQKPEK